MGTVELYERVKGRYLLDVCHSQSMRCHFLFRTEGLLRADASLALRDNMLYRYRYRAVLVLNTMQAVDRLCNAFTSEAWHDTYCTMQRTLE